MGSEGEIVHILARGGGRTIFHGASGKLKIRFDSKDDWRQYDASIRLTEAVVRQDIPAAAGIVFDALNEGLIDDEDDLLDYCAVNDDEALEIVRLEVTGMLTKAIESTSARIAEEGPDDE